jgi:hypothetical protein
VGVTPDESPDLDPAPKPRLQTTVQYMSTV